MDISENLKKELEDIGNNKTLWNKRIEIEDDIYIYNSARNEFRKEIHQPSGKISILIGCMALKQFIKCC